MAHFLCHLGCSHFGTLLLDFYFTENIRRRGLDGVKLIVGDKSLGMLDAVGEVFPEDKYQRCTVHFFSVTPRSKTKLVAKMFKAIHAQKNKKAAGEKIKAMVDTSRTATLLLCRSEPGCAM